MALRVLFRVVLVFAVGASVSAAPLAGAPAAKPSALAPPAFPPARAGVPWTGLVRSARRPNLTARNGVTVQPVTVRSAGRGRYRLRVVFPFSGRWLLLAGRRRLGTVTVRRAAPLTSKLPGADAFPLCAGSHAPYPQYGISLDQTGALWSACREQGRLLRIDPTSGEIRAVLRIPSSPYSIAVGLGAVWSAERSSFVNRIDLRTGGASTAITGGRFAYVWTAAGSVWAHDDDRRLLLRYDPSARRVTAELATGDGKSALVEDAGRIWIVNHRDGTLERIDPATNALTRLARLPGDAPERMVLAAGSLWVTGRGTDLLRVDPATGAVQATVEIGAGAIALVRPAGASGSSPRRPRKTCAATPSSIAFSASIPQRIRSPRRSGRRLRSSSPERLRQAGRSGSPTTFEAGSTGSSPAGSDSAGSSPISDIASRAESTAGSPRSSSSWLTRISFPFQHQLTPDVLTRRRFGAVQRARG